MVEYPAVCVVVMLKLTANRKRERKRERTSSEPPLAGTGSCATCHIIITGKVRSGWAVCTRNDDGKASWELRHMFKSVHYNHICGCFFHPHTKCLRFKDQLLMLLVYVNSYVAQVVAGGLLLHLACSQTTDSCDFKCY